MCRRVIDGRGDQKVQVRVRPQKNAECRHSRLILRAHVWLAGASGPGGRDRRRAAAKGGGAAGRRDGLEHAEGGGKAGPWLADDPTPALTRWQDARRGSRRGWSIHT